MKKILIIYATAGAGHKVAGLALYERLKESSDLDVSCIDSLDYTSSFQKYLYSGTYTFLISRAPAVWGFFFHTLDLKILRPLTRLLRRGYNRLTAGRLHRFLREEQFDVVFSTHFMATEIVSALKRKKQISSKLVTVVTDFDVHSFWATPETDHFAVASEWTQRKLISLGIPPEKCRVTGIPTLRKFSENKDAAALKARLNLELGVFTVLIATGSFGIGPIEEIAGKLEGFQVMVVCGHNRKLYDHLSRLQKGLVKIYGLVNNMDELMAVSDFMITKPGGLSISEALVSGLPMMFFNAIPGQEKGNVEVLKTYGVGVSGCPVDQMAEMLKEYRDNPRRLQDAKENARRLARPRAAEDLREFI